MDRDGLLTLARYHAYANALVLDVMEPMSDTELDQSSPSRGSARGLVRHLLGADVFFVALCQGLAANDIPTFPTIADLRRYWRGVETEMQAFIAGLTQDDLTREIVVPFQLKGKSVRLPIWQLLLQMFTHATHHRGELSIVLSGLGHPLPTLDPILLFAEEAR